MNAFFSEIHRLFQRAIPHKISSRMIATARKRITVSLGYGIPTCGTETKNKYKKKTRCLVLVVSESELLE